MEYDFVKMHGLGNDFVVFDARRTGMMLSSGHVLSIADRRLGVGCDQVIVMGAPRSAGADLWMSIHNADGSEVGACGNASRCVAWLMMQDLRQDTVVIETKAGMLRAEARVDGLVSVDMGQARVDWRSIPLAEARDTLHLGISAGMLHDPVGVGMGNPHAVFFVDDVEAVDLASLGPILEHHPLFPERTNVEIAQVLAPDRLRMRVWERGAGITQACGTGACATLVAAARRELTERRAEILLDGGALTIEWLPDDHVVMTGPVAVAFKGRLTL